MISCNNLSSISTFLAGILSFLASLIALMHFSAIFSLFNPLLHYIYIFEAILWWIFRFLQPFIASCTIQIWLTAAKLTCSCNTLQTPNSFTRSDSCLVVDGEPHPSSTCKMSLLFAPLAVPLFHFTLRLTQSVTCLATDACLTADPGVASSILARSHTFVEIVHEIISTVILLPSPDSLKKGCCQLQAKVCAQITG